jgi:hypothetical protein
MTINNTTDSEQTAGAKGLDKLAWAVSASKVDPTVGLDDLLVGLQLMATDAARRDAAKKTGWWATTPPSMQVIRSGTQALSKWWIAITAGVGGSVGVVGTVTAWITAGNEKVGVPVVVTTIGSTALVLSATAIALALFVKADLDSRGAATSARHTGRAHVAAAFLHATAALPAGDRGPLSAERLLQVLAAFPNKVQVATPASTGFSPVTGVRTRPDGRMQVQVAGQNWIAIEDVERYTTT